MKLAYTISASPTRFAAVAQGRDLTASIRHLAEVGFAGVELAIRDPAQVALDGIVEATARAGVIVPAIGTGQAYLEEGLSLAAADPEVRDGAAARLEAHLDGAERLGALLIVGLIHGPIPPEADRARATEWLLAGLGRVARAARPHGVRIVIEPVNRYESNWLHTVGEVMDLLARLGEDNVGVLPDTFHMNIEEADLREALRRARPRLWHVHVADSNRRAPGSGHLDFAGVVAELAGAGYEAAVSAEIIQEPTFEVAAAQTFRTMAPLLPRRSPPPRSGTQGRPRGPEK
jgi:sugar phosphate isomerase/epimerase